MAIYNLSNKSASIAVVITFKFEGSNESDVIILNTVEDTNIDSSSTITEHPIVSGDMVADHMFKNPLNMTIQGSFQYSSNSNLQALSNSENESHLANIESVFERIKNEGVLCEIVKVSMPEGNFSSKQPRFLTRSSMALQSINWTEHTHSLSYTFTFRQVMLASIVEYDVDTDDAYLPNPTDPVMKSFAAELLDWTMVDQTLFQCLTDNKLMTADFASHMQTLGATAIGAIIAAAFGAAIGGTAGGSALIGAVMTACGCSGPPGWIVGAIVAAVAVIAIGLVKIFKKIKQRRDYTIDQFKKYKREKKMRKEEERFVEFVDSIHGDIVKLDDQILLYGLASNEEQQCIISLDNNVYTFSFCKNNTNNTWDVKIFDIDDNVVSSKSDLASFALDSFDDCMSSNALFLTSMSKHQIFIFKTGEDATNLTSYTIMYSKTDMSKFSSLLSDLIMNRLTR